MLAIGAGCLALGCGNYSNADLEFFNALPSREDIKSNLPEPEPTLRAPSGPQTALRRVLAAAAPAEVVLGQTARLYQDTQNASHLFKTIAEVFVSLAEEVQRHPPTTRAGLERSWGPFGMRENPGFEFRVTIARDPAAAERFNYRFEFRPQGSGEEGYLSFITGHFVRGEGRLGIGAVLFDNRVLADAGIDTRLELDWIQIDYDTRVFPRTVRMEFARLLDTLTFRHAEYADDSGEMQFRFDDAFSATFDISSSWTPGGAGRADATVTRLFGPVGSLSQCWNDAFLLTFHQSDFEAPALLGSEDACPPAPGVP